MWVRRFSCFYLTLLAYLWCPRFIAPNMYAFSFVYSAALGISFEVLTLSTLHKTLHKTLCTCIHTCTNKHTHATKHTQITALHTHHASCCHHGHESAHSQPEADRRGTSQLQAALEVKSCCTYRCLGGSHVNLSWDARLTVTWATLGKLWLLTPEQLPIVYRQPWWWQVLNFTCIAYLRRSLLTWHKPRTRASLTADLLLDFTSSLFRRSSSDAHK